MTQLSQLLHRGVRHLRENPLQHEYSEVSPIRVKGKDDNDLEEHRVTVTVPMRIELPRMIYGQMVAYMREVNYEISGLGHASYENGVFRIEELAELPVQTNTSAHTTLDQESMSKILVDRLKKKNTKPLNFWWHSHVNMSCFWSQTDDDTATQMAKNVPYILSIVGVQSGELRCRVDFGKPVTMTFDSLPIVLTGVHKNHPMVSREHERTAKRDVKAKVTRKDEAFTIKDLEIRNVKLPKDTEIDNYMSQGEDLHAWASPLLGGVYYGE